MAKCYEATLDGRPVAFVGVISQPGPVRSYWRASRVVCLPDFQGVGISNKVLAQVAAAYTATGKPFSVVTSHPAMVAHMAAAKNWRCSWAYGIRKFSETCTERALAGGTRSTCTFVWCGPPDPAACAAWGLTPKTSAPARRKVFASP